MPLTPKAFEVLLTLVREKGQVVSKDALLARVWPDRYVEESNVTQIIFVLRRLLGPDAEGRHCIETVPTRGYRFAGPVSETAAARSTRHGCGAARAGGVVESLAVLPLVNADGKPDLEYLCDGITEALINAFAREPRLKVMARNTVFRYKGHEVDARQVGRTLDVQSVLIGRVLRSGGQLVISVEVVDAEDGSQIWGTRCVRDHTNIIALVEEAAGEIAAGLRLKQTRSAGPGLAQRHTEDEEAYRLYLKGRYLWNKRTTEDITRAVEYFERAIGLDPRYAHAYVGLADSYNLLRTRAGLAPRAASPRIKVALQKALELDDTLAEAHASMGHLMTTFEWDWEGAEREFRRAIELSPSCATARQWYSIYLRAMGRTGEALAETRRAHSLDPLSPTYSAGLVSVYNFARQYERALAACQEALEVNPNSPVLIGHLGMIYMQMGLHAEAVATLEKLSSVCGDHEVTMLLGITYAAAGRIAEARGVLARLLTLSRGEYIPPYYIAQLYANVGEPDAAFEWLERAYESRDADLAYIKVDYKVDCLRRDARIARLLERLGLDGG